MKKGKLNLLILLALIGLGVSVYLTTKHFQVLIKGGLQKPSFCNFNEHFDCDSILMSDYATLGPFPLGGLGLVYFFYLTLAFLYARIAWDSAKSVLAIPFLSTLPSLLFAAYLGYVSSFILKSYCIFCVSLYLVCIAVFLLLRSFMEIPFSQIGNFMWNYLSRLFGKKAPLGFNPAFVGNLLFAVVVLGLGLFVLYGNEKKYASDYEDFDHKAYLDFFYVQKPVSIDPTGRPLWGRAGAPVTIIEFSDFECPFCQRAAVNLKPRLKEHLKDIAFYFFNYPLDRSCNPYMMRDLHEYACTAAKAAVCSQEQGKFWPYHDQLFSHQPKFENDQLMNYAKAVGLDVKKLEECMGSEETKKKILADIEAGKTANLQGTPTVLINGRQIKEWMNPVMLNLVVEEELKKAKAK
ncbi:MAG: thioredoxin domain-containing protein [bacterium]